MKFKSGVIITKNGDENILVATGEAGKAFSGMIKLNGTAAFIAGLLKDGISRDDAITKMLDKYDVEKEKAGESFDRVVDSFAKVGILEDE